jgi:uncharacterized protein
VASPLKAHAGGVLLDVRVKPRARKSAVLGVREGVLEVAVAAPPVDGAANEELIRTLAAHFDLGRRAVRLVSGASSRHKRLSLDGVGLRDIEAALERIG